MKESFNLFRMGLFGAGHGWWSKKDPLPIICHIYPIMMKLFYLEKI